MNARDQITIVLIASAVAGLLFYISPYLGAMAGRPLAPPAEHHPSTSAHIASVQGDVLRRHKGEDLWTPLPEGRNKQLALKQMDGIQVESRSEAVIETSSGYRLRLREHSQVVIEQWSEENRNSPLYLNFLSGDFKLERRGRAGSFLIVKDGKLFYPSQKPEITAHELIVSQETLEPDRMAAPSDELVAESKPESEELSDNKEGQQLANVPQHPGSIETSTSETFDPSEPPRLSNQYIDQVIASQRGLFQKCQSNSIRENGETRGQMLVGLTIDNKGKIEEARILSTDLSDEQLHQCIVSVFSRVKFKPFDGPPIVRSYPISFE